MTNKLEDYLKLAEGAEDSAVHIMNAMAEKYPLGTDFERYNDDIRKMVVFCMDERNAALARALIEAEAALIYARKELWDDLHASMSEQQFNEQVALEIDQTLATIQKLKDGKDE